MESVGIAHGFAVVVVLLKQRDSFRHLSSKTETSWKIERWMIHILVFFCYYYCLLLSIILE
jgi:hypothetical protein